MKTVKIKCGWLNVNLIDFLFFLVAFFGVVTLFFTIYYNESIIRILSYAMFLIGYSLYYISIKSGGIGKTEIISLIYLALIMFIWAYSNFEYEVLVTSLSFFLIFSSFESIKTIKMHERLIGYLYFFYLAQAFLLIFTSFSKYAKLSSVESDILSNDLLLGLPNPNETGMVLAYTIMGLYICMRKKRSKWIKHVTILIMGYLFYLILLTRSRTSFIGVSIFFILSVVYKSNKGKLFTNKCLYLIFLIFPIVFVPVYLAMFNGFVNRSTFFGKTIFSGRQDVYAEYLFKWNNKVLGNINIFHLSNAHNGFFTVLLNYGILGFMIYILHLISNLNIMKKNKCLCEVSRAGFIAILCLYFMSATEAAFIVAGKYYYSNFLILTGLANYSEEDKG